MYENYFRNKDSETSKWEQLDNGLSRKEHDDEKNYEFVEYSPWSVSYSGTYGWGEKESYTFEKTDETVIEEETKNLFELVGLPYDKESGYAIERTTVHEDNSVEVDLCRYIEGRKVSLTGGIDDIELNKVEIVTLEFGSNRLLSVMFLGLTDVIKVEAYEDDIFLDEPEKAFRIAADYLSRISLDKNKVFETAQIAYVATEVDENGVYTLIPKAEFIDKEDKNTYQVDLFTKQVEQNRY